MERESLLKDVECYASKVSDYALDKLEHTIWKLLRILRNSFDTDSGNRAKVAVLYVPFVLRCAEKSGSKDFSCEVNSM